jgi:hypothetical protein
MALALAAAPAANALPTDPPLSILGTTTTPLSVTGEKGADTAETKLTVLNAGETPAKVSIELQASSSETVKASLLKEEKAVKEVEVPAGKAQRIAVQLSGLADLKEAVTGQLVLTGGKEPVAQAVEVVPPAPDEHWPAILIWGSLAATIVFAGFVVGAMKDKGLLWKPAPNPKLAFSSWGTALTAVGALSGTVLGQTTFPTVPHQISKTELVNLNIFFGLVLVVGPFLFEALRRFHPTQAKQGRTGYNFTVLISCALTIWAVVGQLGTFGLLGWELVGGGDSGTALAIVAGLIALGALWYFFTTTSEMVLRDWKKEEEEKEKKEKEAAEKGKCCPQPAAASWHLL